MGKVTHHGWSTSSDEIPEPTSILMGRYVEIDDGDPEGTHLWVSVNDEYFSMIELIDQFTIDERDRAYRVASRLSNLLNIPMKLKEGPHSPHYLGC